MPAFHYDAMTAAGQSARGVLDASTETEAVSQLSRQGLVVLRLATSAPGGWRARLDQPLHFGRGGTLRSREVLRLLQSLATLLGAGLTIDRALQVLSATPLRPRVSAVSDGLLAKVREGQSFATAVTEALPRLPPFVVPMLRSGEAGGRLAAVLSEIAQLMTRMDQLKRRLSASLIYPSLLAVMVIATLMIVVSVVLPRFESLFLESRAALPTSTAAMLGLGRWLGAYGWLLPLLIIGMLGLLKMLRRGADFRLQSDGAWLRVPLVGRVVAALQTGRFLQVLGSMLHSGLPLQRALPIANEVLSNAALRASSERIAVGVREGKVLSRLIGGEAHWPPIIAQLLRVGEETGKLDAMMLNVATILTDEGEENLSRAVGLVVPVITIAMGLLVAAMIGSILVGVLSVNELAL